MSLNLNYSKMERYRTDSVAPVVGESLYLIHEGRFTLHVTKTTISRVTKTLYITADNRRWVIGRDCAQGGHREGIVPYKVTPAAKEEVTRFKKYLRIYDSIQSQPKKIVDSLPLGLAELLHQHIVDTLVTTK